MPLPSKPASLPSPKRIGIVGSRRRNTNNDMVSCLVAFDKVYKPGDTLVSGGCSQGGDAFAESIAKARGLSILIHYPDWNGPAGKAAGFVRNSLIARDADVLIAIVSPDRTGGAEDTVKKMLKLRKPVIIVE